MLSFLPSFPHTFYMYSNLLPIGIQQPNDVIFAHTADADDLLASPMAGDDLDLRLADGQDVGEELDQGLVGGPVDRRRRQPDLE